MKIRKAHRKTLLASAAFGALSLTGTMAWAQEDDATTDDDVIEVIEEDEDEARQEKVTVTGSRLKRDTFSSVAPLQVITADTAIESGLIDSAEILKSGTSVTGVQLDTNINSAFVQNGGPGASNVSLRGLGADRTLVLVNGRRFAPAGVEGAPSLPDINLIPSSMIARVETLLDGASSIYGSDAIAGVQNVILRDEFDGLAFQTFNREPFADKGKTERYSMIMGATGDEGKFVVSAEYRAQEDIRFQDRDWQYDDNGIPCSFDFEVDSATGDVSRFCGSAVGAAEFRTLTTPFGVGPSPFGATGWFRPTAGAPTSNTFLTRATFLEAEDNLTPEQTVFSVYAIGDRNVNVFGHDTNAFMEMSYSNSQTFVRNGFHGQLFPTVSADNPFNPYGTNGDSVFAGGGGLDAVPVIFSPIRRSDIDVDVVQTRFTGGFRGALDFLPEGFLNDWEYELYGQYSRSVGDSIRPAVNEERLFLSLNTSRIENGEIVCGNDAPDIFGFNSQETCVPINLFAPSLYSNTNPQFATQAELDYISAERSVTTKVDQTMLGGFITGDLFTLPGGEAGGVIGFEYREDGLDSGTDTIAATGGAAGFFADRRSIGQVSLFEAYGEIELPLLSDQPFAEDLTVNLSGRFVNHEFFDNEFVYSGKIGYSPVDFLTIRGTYGTAYRAPGLRELFLGGQSGFSGGRVDPCIVPIAALEPDDGDPTTPRVYIPENDTRNQQVLANCSSEGIDPTQLGSDGVPGIETFRAGNTGLDPETSTAWTAGFVFEQPWTEAIDVSLGVTYFDIEVEDAPVIPTTTFILSQCYNSPDFPTDPFCAERTRDPATGFLSTVNITPFNLDIFEASGVDVNLRTEVEFPAFGRDWNFTTDTVATYAEKINQTTLADSSTQEFVGDSGFPEWRANMNARLETGPVTFFYGLTFIGEQDADRRAVTQELNGTLADARDYSTETGARTSSDTIISKIDDYFLHTVSVEYQADTWNMTVGLRNVLDEDPPLVDQNSFNPFLVGNVPAGTGYDILGRSLFLQLTKEF